MACLNGPNCNCNSCFLSFVNGYKNTYNNHLYYSKIKPLTNKQNLKENTYNYFQDVIKEIIDKIIDKLPDNTNVEQEELIKDVIKGLKMKAFL